MQDDKQNNKQNEIDEQMASSIKKLVEEETTVARAFVTINETEDKNNDIKKKEDTATMHTQVIPDLTEELEERRREAAKKDTIPDTTLMDINVEYKDYKQADKSMESIKDVAKKAEDSTESAPDSKHKKSLTKKQKLTIGIAAGAVAVVIAIIIIVIVVSNGNKKKSYQYNFDQGMKYYNEQDYSVALPYLEKAADTSKGKNNADLQFDLYLCYRNLNQDDQALNTLTNILSFDKNNEKAIRALASFYMEKKDSSALNELIQKYDGTDAETYLEDYKVSKPVPSVEAGSYNENVKLQFVADSECKVYYTLDSSTPTEKSTLYDDIIEIKAGTTTVKAVSVNSMGVYSDAVELKYEIDYKKPDAPTVSPASGTYESGQMISIDNIPEGSKVYYTTDGSTPTEKSKVYTDTFAMPEGNTIVSAIIIDQNKQVSSITKRNYVVNKASVKQLTYEEAVAGLKSQLQSRGVAVANATFSNQSKITVQGIEIYHIKCDIKSGTQTTTGYYGVDVKTGTCYSVTQSGSSYTLAAL